MLYTVAVDTCDPCNKLSILYDCFKYWSFSRLSDSASLSVYYGSINPFNNVVAYLNMMKEMLFGCVIVYSISLRNM